MDSYTTAGEIGGLLAVVALVALLHYAGVAVRRIVARRRRRAADPHLSTVRGMARLHRGVRRG